MSLAVRVVQLGVAVLLVGLMLVIVDVHQQQGDLQRRHRVVTADVASLSDRVETAERDAEAMRTVLSALPVPLDAPRLVEVAQASVFRVEVGGWQGSAFVIQASAEGVRMLTSYHVIADAWTSYQRDVRLVGEEASGRGTIVAVDAEADLAVIEVARSWPALTTTAEVPSTGAQVLVLGAPLGLDDTVAVGVVSGFREGFIQLSAPVSPGSSGSPVLDADGTVVAVVAGKFVEEGAEGLTFAVPIAKACEKVLRC